MSRVTKINVGGTNYDIAHEGELKNSGFEVVTSLPTTGLFAGREVMYNGKKYVYSSGWKEEITANTMYEANLLWGGRNITDGYSPIDNVMMPDYSANVMAFPTPSSISVEYSRDGGVSWLDYGATDQEKVELFTSQSRLTCGNAVKDSLPATVGYQLRITITPANTNLFAELNKIIMYINANGSLDCWCSFKGLKVKEFAAGHEDDEYYTTIVNKAVIYGWEGFNVLNFNTIITGNNLTHAERYYRMRLIFGYDNVYSSSYRGLQILRLRFFGRNRWLVPSNLAATNHLYTYNWKQNALFPARVESKEVINFNINNIEPTQTGSSALKTSTWLWQYLVQGVNWLKANDNTKLDKRSYNQVYTNCGYTNITSSTTGALIIELPFAPSNDANNSMTYIELNVYSHKKGCSKYIIGVYSYSSSSSYEWSVYSYMGYNYFSSITQARRTDNNNIVIVLGNFTDVHFYEHFSISHIVTGFNRNNDDTDQFLIYTDSTSSNYTSLKDSSYIPQVISYNDLTDTPTLAAVARSGSYNDLTDKPTFSGSYNDLTDKPNLATVATSGNYDDLLNKPALVFSNIGGTISSVQIPDGLIANAKLANPSMSLNGITVNLGDTANVPWYLDYNEIDYPARLRDHWLQLYRNGVWANLVYLGDILPTQVGQITSLDNLDWYNEQVSEYEVDSTTTTSILNGTTLPATLLLSCTAEQLTLNLYPISGKQYGKGSLDNLITNLQDKGFSVFVENDLDAIIGSGSDYLVRIKISKVPTVKAIIECYVSR